MTSLKKESRGHSFTHHRFNVCLVIRDDKARKSIDAKLTRSSSYSLEKANASFLDLELFLFFEETKMKKNSDVKCSLM